MSIFWQKTLNIGTIIRQLVPAQPCVLCGSMGHSGLWCKACDAAMPRLALPRCPVCAHPGPGGEVCGQCLKNPPLFDRTIAVFSYQFPVDRLIQSLKYHEQLALGRVFAEKLKACTEPNDLPDCVIPMPLHPSRLKNRGFNQARLIAAPLAKSLHRPLLDHACHRVRDTPSQTSLPWPERSKNMRGAFSCEMDLSGMRVALVDDVLTTGASLNALADAVKKQGAIEIDAWVVARTVRD
ncbi:MAG: ComF family protein [Gallionella sp.]|nr:ComF family protein [Gallionella sp.]